MMSSSENIPPLADMQAAGNRKGSSAAVAGAQQRTQPAPPPGEQLKCPRCDSANTKFCYYNNYSLSQPRHFCKTCRRYWTKGGALRNVPIGGGCRKTKKMKPSPASASRFLSNLDPTGQEFGPGGSAFKLLGGPAMEFQLGGLSLPRLHPATAGVYSQFVSAGQAGGGFGLDLLGGLSYPAAPNPSGSGHAVEHNPISISSIESLSSINQEMHWKLQQQRLAMIYANNNPTAPGDGSEDDHHQDGVRDHDLDHHESQKQMKEKPSTAMNLFQTFEISSNSNSHQNSASKVTDHHHHHVSMANNIHQQQQQQNIINCGGSSTRKLEVGPTEWFFDQATYAPASHNSTDLHLSGEQVQGGGVVASWGDLHHFNGLQ